MKRSELWGLVCGIALIMVPVPVAFAVEKLSDQELSASAGVNIKPLEIIQILHCPEKLSAVECERLRTQRYASEGQTKESYKIFLDNETMTPISNQVIKQPLLSQPMSYE